jgi:predicted enzyme related to lactoylglutathione lyase
MAVAHGTRVNRVAWIDLASSDAGAAREFYGKLFGWKAEVNPDPQYGGYALAKLPDGGEDVAGIGPTQSPEQPTTWSVYIGTDDADALSEKVKAAGGTVVAPAFDVGPLGRMAVFQDPSGAYISAWQPSGMGSFRAGHSEPGTFGWAELNARGIDKAIAFYKEVFGWTAETSPMGEGQPPYTEFHRGDHSIAGAMEMSPMVPAEMPSYWMVYFDVADVDDAFKRAIDAGAREMMAPDDYPGGRYAILSDPQGAAFGLLKGK